MRLYVRSGYQNRDTEYQAGEVIEVSEERARFLMNDAPGCFAPVEVTEEKAVDAPPRDKMLRRGKVTK